MTTDTIKEEMQRAIGETMAKSLQEQEAAEARFRAEQEKVASQINEARSEMLDAFTKARTTPKVSYPPEILEIANLLMQQPRLIQPTQQFLTTLVAKINEAVTGVINDLVGSETTNP